ncbi:MAG: site-specific DNA-methyltransferase [Clostridiales bacterium]|nr:site-specific DNA-methyltransferase [Clostridiales bacterium]
MSNISAEKRKILIEKIKYIREFISNAQQDENTENLLKYISDIEKDIKTKKFGLVFEEHKESIDETLETHVPVLTEEKDLFVDNGDNLNFLIEGDNLSSLKILSKTHKDKVDLIYIDPPYNTGNKSWKYNNDYVDSNDTFKHSKWLSMMNVRLLECKKLLTPKGVLICAIDENEVATLKLLLEEIFGEGYEYVCVTIVHNPRGIQGKNFSYTNEFAYFVIPKGDKIIGGRKIPESEIDWRNLRDNGGESLRTDARNCFYPIITDGENVLGFGDVLYDESLHPKQCENIDGLFYIYPIDIKGIERKWRYARQTVDKIKDLLRVKKTKNTYEIELGKPFGTYRTVWIDSRYDSNEYGKKIINSLVPESPFDFPKSLWNVYDCLYSVISENKNAIVLDFFAGSGTTGHALMELNKEDGGNRKFILCTNNENNICREVTYERIKRAIMREDYKASLKYMKVNFMPISDKLYYEYADDLLKYTKELVELENSINFDNNDSIKIILTNEELDELTSALPDGIKNIYISHNVLTTGEQEKLFEDKGIEIHNIPDYYYKDLVG